MAQNDHQAGAKLLCREFNAANLGRRHDVTGDADHEQIAETLIEDDFHGNARIGTAQHGGKGLLAGREVEPAHATRDRIAIARIGDEALITLAQ
jgi:hypothetical protein